MPEAFLSVANHQCMLDWLVRLASIGIPLSGGFCQHLKNPKQPRCNGYLDENHREGCCEKDTTPPVGSSRFCHVKIGKPSPRPEEHRNDKNTLQDQTDFSQPQHFHFLQTRQSAIGTLPELSRGTGPTAGKLLTMGALQDRQQPCDPGIFF